MKIISHPCNFAFAAALALAGPSMAQDQTPFAVESAERRREDSTRQAQAGRGQAERARRTAEREAETRRRTITMARPVARAGEAERGWIGLAFEVERLIRETSGFGVVRRPEGQEIVRIRSVYPGSPAARAGVQAGDVVVRIDGRTPTDELVRAFALSPGDTVRLVVRRGNNNREFRLIAEPRPERLAIPFGPTRLRSPRAPGDVQEIIVLRRNGHRLRMMPDSVAMRLDRVARRLRIVVSDSLGRHLRGMGPHLDSVARQLRRFPRGLSGDTILFSRPGESLFLEFGAGMRSIAGAEFAELNSELAEYFRGTERGLLVLRVAPGTPAARSGLQAGDVVVSAAGERVGSVRELRAAVTRAGRERTLKLEVVRKGRRNELPLRWE